MEAQCFQQLNMKILVSKLHQGVELFNYFMKTMQVIRLCGITFISKGQMNAFQDM